MSDGGNKSSLPAIIELDVQPPKQVESHETDIIVMVNSPVLKDGSPLIRLPFSSPRADCEKEALLTSSTPSRGSDTGIVAAIITPLPKHVESSDLESASSPSGPQPGCLSPIFPARNRFKVTFYSFVYAKVKLILISLC